MKGHKANWLMLASGMGAHAEWKVYIYNRIEKPKDFKEVHPNWTCFPPGLDLHEDEGNGGRGEVHKIENWQETHTIEDLKNYVVEKEISGFTFIKGSVRFVKVDTRPNLDDLEDVSSKYEC